MTELRLYNTMTHQKQPFVPREAGKAAIYVCGPTPYAPSHMGHARCYCIYDTLVRLLKARGLAVTYVRNVTDVDDKIINRSRESGEAPTALAERFYRSYLADMDAMGCLRPTVEPKVSETIPEIVAIVEQLVDKGAAYVVEREGGANDVYFSVRTFPDYGKLSGRNVDDLRAGARVDVDERKRDAVDFALWKGAKPGEPSWPSPWGLGRPGWHIECSAMAAKFLGNGFDLHGGGLDLVFPHHENEIAQSEAASGSTFCSTWMHNGFLELNKEKMSKSTGNFFSIASVLEHAEPETIRYFFHTMHYRSPLNFEWQSDAAGKVTGYPAIEEAERRLEYLYATRARLSAIPEERLGDGPSSPDIARTAERALAALSDDLNTPEALAALAELAKLANELCDRAERKKGGLVPIAAVEDAIGAFDRFAELLGVLREDPEKFAARIQKRRIERSGLSPAWIEERIAARAGARKNKDFAKADQIRDELAGRGVEIKDSPAGTVWRLP